jgi:diguanylate cyclase
MTPYEVLEQARTALDAADSAAARAAAERALRLAETSADAALHARALAMLAHVAFYEDEPARALGDANAAVDRARRAGDDLALAEAQFVQAITLLGSGDAEGALEAGRGALEAAERSGGFGAQSSTADSGRGQAAIDACDALLSVYTELQRWDAAHAIGQRWSELVRAFGEPKLEGRATLSISFIWGRQAHAAQKRGDSAKHDACIAEHNRTARAALALARASRDRLSELTLVANLAETLSDEGHHEAGMAMLQSCPIDTERDPKRKQVRYTEARAILLERMGRLDEAAELLQQALEGTPNALYERDLRDVLAGVLERRQDWRGAFLQCKALLAIEAQLNYDRAQRSAAVMAVRLRTAQAEATAAEMRSEKERLARESAQLERRSRDFQRQALEDALTGLPNRRRLDELLAEDLRAWALVMVDIDHFKQVNDRHSHLVGDAVLRELAQLLRATCRGQDTALRFGGEEFALLLRGTDATGAYASAERARKIIESHHWARVAPGLQVTASFGIAHGAEAPSSAELLALADRRLYAAKNAGRNRVVGAEEASVPAASAGASKNQSKTRKQAVAEGGGIQVSD